MLSCRGLHKGLLLSNLYRALVTVVLFACLAGCTRSSGLDAVEKPVGSTVFHADSGESVQADYYSDGRVILSFSEDGIKVLKRAVSASGARYVSGSDEWWEHQGEGRYSIIGKIVFVGTARK